MRWFNTIVIVAFVGAMLIFALQNFQTVTVSFLGFQISAPLALQIAIVYLLGMATGGSLWALMRWALQGPRQVS